ncbi:unnamed protein product [Durusdinium trenchii]|uniref:Uncharacterized protein n=1 Tax=Durusdinium trenchii TaxID=1381693 RepID=A0ABP0MF97_9DINO
MAGLRVIYGTLIGVSLIGEEPRQMGVQSKSSPNLHEAEKAVSRAEAYVNDLERRADQKTFLHQFPQPQAAPVQRRGP